MCGKFTAQMTWGEYIALAGVGSDGGVTPGVVTVSKSKEDIQAHCTKAGWQDGVATIPSNFQGWTVGNIILGGVIGLGVDAATGAINEYPHTFQIPMVPLNGYGSVLPPQGMTPPPAKPVS
jgi:hypothetical protein